MLIIKKKKKKTIDRYITEDKYAKELWSVDLLIILHKG